MGRCYIVEEAVEGYLSTLCGQGATITGLLIGQSSAQRDFVLFATRTPQREESAPTAANSVDKEWITEHSRQVSRMLPGGLSVLGVFIISDKDAKDTLTTLRQLVFAVDHLISSERLWALAEEDVSESITLHINPKTRKIVCRTFDIKDPKSMAKPADWKYQAGVCSSWATVSCCLNVDLLVPLSVGTENMEESVKGGLKAWARQIENGVILIDGKKLPEDLDLTAGQRRNVRQTYRAQLLVTSGDQSIKEVIQPCQGSVSVRGTIHGRAYVHSNKPKAKLAERLLKRDVISTVATRVQMLLEDMQATDEQRTSSKQSTEQTSLPHRVFCPLKSSGSVCVCDYRFSDEGLSEVTERLKEMLDMDTTDSDLDTSQEILPEIPESLNVEAEPVKENVEAPNSQKSNYLGVVIATAVGLLATAASMLYLSDV